jgi:hypothetical protein
VSDTARRRPGRAYPVSQRTVTIRVGWLLVVAAVVAVVAVARMVQPSPVIDPADVRAVCAEYAHLDLSALAPLCVKAGYQQVVNVPTLAPEDLGRPSG